MANVRLQKGTNMIKLLSLFSGIGAFESALKRGGMNLNLCIIVKLTNMLVKFILKCTMLVKN